MSKNMVREFYAAILRVANLEELSMEVLWCKTNFTVFPNIPQSDEGWPTKGEVFQMLLG